MKKAVKRSFQLLVLSLVVAFFVFLWTALAISTYAVFVVAGTVLFSVGIVTGFKRAIVGK